MTAAAAVARLADIGLDAKSMANFVAKSAEIKAGIISKAHEAQEYWKSIAPVSTRPAHPLQKGSVHIEEPGDYRDSIRVRYEKKGGFSARVYSNDPVARWVEYGSHPGGKNYQPEQACAARTVEHFNGSTNRDDNPSGVGEIRG